MAGKIDLFVLPVVGRSADSVVPSDKRGMVTVRSWTPPYTADSPQAVSYYSVLCNALCTTENKRTATNHISLWRHLSTSEDISEYVVVIEDDNTALQLFLDTVPAIIAALPATGIEMLQISSSGSSSVAGRIPLTTNPPMYATSYAYVNLNAYIIRREAAAKLHTAFASKKVSTSLSLEMLSVTRTHDIKHAAIENGSSLVEHDYELINKARIEARGPALHQRLSTWAARSYPEAFSAMTTPIISIFGKVNLSVSGVIVLLAVVLCLVFDVRSRFVWFIVGMMVSWSIQ